MQQEGYSIFFCVKTSSLRRNKIARTNCSETFSINTPKGMPLIRFGNNARPEKAADLQMRNGSTWGSFRILQRSPSKPNSFLRGRSS